jgi:hypothetical protein
MTRRSNKLNFNYVVAVHLYNRTKISAAKPLLGKIASQYQGVKFLVVHDDSPGYAVTNCGASARWPRRSSARRTAFCGRSRPRIWSSCCHSSRCHSERSEESPILETNIDVPFSQIHLAKQNIEAPQKNIDVPFPKIDLVKQNIASLLRNIDPLFG